MYFIQTFYWHVEKDHFENGCDPSTARDFIIDCYIQADTLDELINCLKQSFDTPRQAMSLRACGEENRIDIQFLVDKDNVPASLGEVNHWKAGKEELWLADVSCYVYEAKEAVLPVR